MILILITIQQIHSQEDGVVAFTLPVRNSLKFNKYAINPTFSFVREQNAHISFTNKREWSQFDNPPQTYLFSYSGRFSENMGLGIGLFQQDYGVLSTFGGVLNYAYNVVLNKDSNLTFGMNLGLYKSGINEGNVITNYPDPSLNNIPSHMLMTLNPGINYGTAFFDFGVSLNNFVLYNIKTSKLIEDDSEKGVQAHIMYTGYIQSRGFFDNARFSGLLRSEFIKDNTVVSGIMMVASPKGIWGQVGYNSLYGASAGIGLNLTTQIAIEYNFEKALGDLTDFGPSHEITLAYKFNNRTRYNYSEEDEVTSIIPKAKKKVLASQQPKIDPEIREKRRAEIEAKREEAKALAKAEEEAKQQLALERKAKQEEEAKAKQEAEIKAKAEQAEQAKIEAEAKAKQEAEAKAKAEQLAQARREAAAKAKAEQEAQAKKEAEEKAQAEAEARVKAEQEAQAKLEAEARIKAEQEAQAKLEAEAKLKAEQEAQARLEAEAKTKAEQEAQAKLEAEAKAQADEEARVKAEQEAQAKLEAEAKAQAEEEARAKAEREQAIANPTDNIGIAMKDLIELTQDSSIKQEDLLTQLKETVANRDQDLKDLKEENDLSEQGIFKEPKPFKSLSTENAILESLKLELDSQIEAQGLKITELENLYNQRLKIVNDENDEINMIYLDEITILKKKQEEAKRTRASLLSELEAIKLKTEIERSRRIRRAAYDNQEERYLKDMATLNQIKQNTPVSSTPFKVEDFDFGEELGNNIRILKDVKNAENGFYLVVAVHSDVTKRDEFLTKTVASGQADISFFFDVNTSKYYIFYQKFDSLNEARNGLQSKDSKPYNSKMTIVKIEN
jgi:type IX secretion system PorP/SprF family membrane protein